MAVAPEQSSFTESLIFSPFLISLLYWTIFCKTKEETNKQSFDFYDASGRLLMFWLKESGDPEEKNIGLGYYDGAFSCIKRETEKERLLRERMFSIFFKNISTNFICFVFIEFLSSADGNNERRVKEEDGTAFTLSFLSSGLFSVLP